MAKGWAKPGNAKKFHYFDDSIFSLCRKWMYNADPDELEDDKHDHPDNCKVCMARLKARTKESNS